MDKLALINEFAAWYDRQNDSDPECGYANMWNDGPIFALEEFMDFLFEKDLISD